MSEQLTPPDLERCQAEIPIRHTFMTLGGRPGHLRCGAPPTVVATEIEPGKDGEIGSLSLCGDCLVVFTEQLPDDFATIAPIGQHQAAANKGAICKVTLVHAEGALDAVYIALGLGAPSRADVNDLWDQMAEHIAMTLVVGRDGTVVEAGGTRVEADAGTATGTCGACGEEGGNVSDEEGRPDPVGWDWVTPEQLEEAIRTCAAGTDLMALPGVYEIVSEELNNEALAHLASAHGRCIHCGAPDDNDCDCEGRQ